MINRRKLIAGTTLLASAGIWPSKAEVADARLVFVHGRSQEGRKPAEIKEEWLGALREGAVSNSKTLPAGLQVELPFYGDRLEEFTKMSKIPLASDVKVRGGAETDEFLQFQAELAEEIRVAKGITHEQVNAEISSDIRQRGVENWEWVQAIIAAIDKHSEGLSSAALERVTRDVFLYTNYPVVRDEIDKIVRSSIDERPTIMIAHSLGSVVAYSVLQTDTRALNVHLITIGSPLAIRAIRRRFSPISFPPHVQSWRNAFDIRDVVALFPLDKNNFDVAPAVENFGEVKNKTENRHGIIGYLDDKTVAGWVLADL